MPATPEKFIVLPFNQEIHDEDTVLRRIHKRQQINEEGNVRLTAFLLRKKLEKTGKPENQISIFVEKIQPVPALDNRSTYCRLIAEEIRKTKVGVWHSPTDEGYKNSHGSLCGYFDENKALALSNIAVVI